MLTMVGCLCATVFKTLSAHLTIEARRCEPFASYVVSDLDWSGGVWSNSDDFTSTFVSSNEWKVGVQWPKNISNVTTWILSSPISIDSVQISVADTRVIDLDEALTRLQVRHNGLLCIVFDLSSFFLGNCSFLCLWNIDHFECLILATINGYEFIL